MAEDGFKYAEELETLFDCSFDKTSLGIYKLLHHAFFIDSGLIYETLDHW
jgi:hypothetical protein